MSRYAASAAAAASDCSPCSPSWWCEVLLGAALLRAWGVVDPTSTSFLGVGLVAVLALLFFLSALDSVWMLLVLPVLTAITFLLSWWVTETFVEQGAGDDLHR